MSYETRLLAMKQQLKTKTPKKRVPVVQSITPAAPFYEEKWLATGLEKEENEFGTTYKRVKKYPKNYQHGKIQLGDLTEIVKKWQLQLQHPLIPPIENRIVFFDTETTGLKGTGTYIFLVGFLEETKDSFILTQYLMPNPEHEAAFLYATALWREPVTLISYNGKSFDVPQLATRWTLNRKKLPPLIEHAQIDLLHSTRRIWQGELDRFRLTTVEEEVLDFHRIGDIPGHLAPIIYQDAVKSGEIGALHKVLEHNEWDLLSLVSLYIYSSRLLLQEQVETPRSQLNIGRWYVQLKQEEQGLQFFESILQEYGENHPLTHYHFAKIMKRRKRYVEAAQAYEQAIGLARGREVILAYEQLAMLAEHQQSDVRLAKDWAQKGLSQLTQDGTVTPRFRQRYRACFIHRIKRLKHKELLNQSFSTNDNHE